jgi:Fe2+ transport system protein B
MEIPMNISPSEAEQALAAIQKMSQKTRHSIASSGAYIFLIVTGVIWLVGFLATQFLPAQITTIIWTGMSLLGSVVAVILGIRMGRRVRSPLVNASAKQAMLFWSLLVCFCIATIAVAKPTDGRQVTMFIILFTMIGQLAMGLLLSFSSVWWTLPITALALAGYFLVPGFFYLWMGILGGGGMIVLGLYIRSRW